MESSKDYGKLNNILNEMGKIAHEMFPKTSPEFFSKRFETGIKLAFKVHKCKTWDDVEKLDINARKRIIRGIMNVSQHQFEDAGMFGPEVDQLYNKIDHHLERLVS